MTTIENKGTFWRRVICFFFGHLKASERSSFCLRCHNHLGVPLMPDPPARPKADTLETFDGVFKKIAEYETNSIPRYQAPPLPPKQDGPIKIDVFKTMDALNEFVVKENARVINITEFKVYEDSLPMIKGPAFEIYGDRYRLYYEIAVKQPLPPERISIIKPTSEIRNPNQDYIIK